MARKKANIHYLYKTTCIVTDRWYIGMHSTCNMDDGYMGSGKRLRASLRKHGVDNHVKEILEFFETRELLIEAEIKAITEDMVLDKNCMNLKLGGQGGGGIWSESHKINFSKGGNKVKSLMLKNDLEFKKRCGAKSYDNLKKHLSSGEHNYKTFLGKKHTEETKNKMRKPKNIGETNSQYGTCWITKEGLNKKIKKEELDSHLNEGWIQGRVR
jgi:hypothetical protein